MWSYVLDIIIDSRNIFKLTLPIFCLLIYIVYGAVSLLIEFHYMRYSQIGETFIRQITKQISKMDENRNSSKEIYQLHIFVQKEFYQMYVCTDS